VNVKVIVLGVACLVPCALVAQNTIRDQVYFGAIGGVATLSGDASAIITPRQLRPMTRAMVPRRVFSPGHTFAITSASRLITFGTATMWC